jgi:hypothetical protein
MAFDFEFIFILIIDSAVIIGLSLYESRSMMTFTKSCIVEFAISTKDIYYVQNLTRNIATFFGEYFSRRVSGQAKIFGGFKIGTKIYTL